MVNIITRKLCSPDSLCIKGIPVIYIIYDGNVSITIDRHMFNITEKGYTVNDKYAVYPTKYKLNNNVCVIDCTLNISIHTIDKSYMLSDNINELNVLIEQLTGTCLIKYDIIPFSYFNNIIHILDKQYNHLLNIKNKPDVIYLQNKYTINEIEHLHDKLRDNIDNNYNISLNYDKNNINKLSVIDPKQRISEYQLIKLQQAINAKNNYLTNISRNYNNKNRLIDKCSTLITKYNDLATSYNNTHTRNEVNDMINRLYKNSNELILLKNKLNNNLSIRRQLNVKLMHINRLTKEVNLLVK